MPATPTLPILLIGPALGAVLAGSVHAGPPAVRFVACETCGLGPYVMEDGMGAGVAAADFDDDGDVDLFVPMAAGTPDALYRNLGDGTFEDVAGEAGVASIRSSRCALWFDADGDGDLDLLVAGDDPDAISTYRLYRQDPPAAGDSTPRFEDVTEASGLLQPLPDPVYATGVHRGGLTAGDLDGDGALDLVSCLWNGYPQIFHNDGAGVFTDVTETSDVTTIVPFSHQAVLFDVNGDGLQDIFLAVDFRENALYLNDGDLTFTDVAAAAGADNAWNDMGIALGDFDRDGDFDLYVTNIEAPGVHSVLLRNDTVGAAVAFTEVSQTLGVANGGWAWGTTFIDADNDGRLDIAATNGWDTEDYVDDVSHLWRQAASPDEPFEDVAEAVDFDDTDWGSSLVAFDADRDGDLDLVQTCNAGGPLRLLRNDRLDGGVGANHLVVRPRMTAGGNRRAIGAVVRVEAAGVSRLRPITAGISYLGQEPAEAFFGLGPVETVDRVEIRWPDGRRTCLTDLAVNQVLDVLDDGAACPVEADLDGDGAVSATDLVLLLAAWGPCPACPADLDDDGVVGLEDLLALLLAWT